MEKTATVQKSEIWQVKLFPNAATFPRLPKLREKVVSTNKDKIRIYDLPKCNQKPKLNKMLKIESHQESEFNCYKNVDRKSAKVSIDKKIETNK